MCVKKWVLDVMEMRGGVMHRRRRRHQEKNVHSTNENNKRYISILVRMSVLDTEVDGSNPGSSMLFP